MQENTQVQTTPPLSGAALVEQINDALQTIQSMLSGSDDPASLAVPFCLWADSGTGRLRIRNAANSAWVDLGPLVAESPTPVDGAVLASQAWVTSKLNGSVRVFNVASLPTSDIGPILVVGYAGGLGTMRWNGSAYAYSGPAYGLLRMVVISTSGTYTRGAGCVSGMVEVWGAGGGSTAGGQSSFNGTDLVAGGGAIGSGLLAPGVGGVATSTLSNAVLINGGCAGESQASVYIGYGGESPRGGPGGRKPNLNGISPGGGGGVQGNSFAASGGGAYASAFYSAMPATAAAVIGTGGTAATDRGAGGSGRIVVHEYGVIA